jgi:membrane-bound lytic murein transglycosylase A
LPTRFALLFAVFFAGALSASAAGEVKPLRIPDTALEFLSFADLDGWSVDDHVEAFATFRKSCAVLRKRGERHRARPLDEALRDVCPRAMKPPERPDRETARRFFEENFRPVRIAELGESEGLLTGYYEPEVEGRRAVTTEFSVPIYRKPEELVTRVRRFIRRKIARLGRIVRRVGHRFAPYHERAAIEDGALKGRDLEICWVRDPIDAFFIHIQGSARVRLEDGAIVRLNYAAQNGHTYTSVGRLLIEKGIVSREDMTMERIRAFIAEDPDAGRELMRMNKSFVFFREASELPPNAEAVGAQGISLTRARSIAVDRAIHAFGSPFWVEAELPLESEAGATRFRHLMIAQDTGGAIVGPARADIYFGAGAEAGAVAGRIRHRGRFYLLVPRAADPARRLDPAPLPRPKP